MSAKTLLLAAASVAGSAHSGAAAAMLAHSVMYEDSRNPSSLELERTGGMRIHPAPRKRPSRSKRLGRVLRVLVKAAA